MWDLDLQDFYDTLFTSIARLVADPEAEKYVDLLIQALRISLYETRQLSTDRVAGLRLSAFVRLRACLCLSVCLC